jgi:MerR family transcriptional regulator, mercuric resistance operon regulatory protein
VTRLHIIKTAQAIGFSLDEVAGLIDAGTHRHGRGNPGLQAQAEAKMAEIDQKIAKLTAIRTSLQQAIAAGCDDLVLCAADARCPIPLVALTRPES